MATKATKSVGFTCMYFQCMFDIVCPIGIGDNVLVKIFSWFLFIAATCGLALIVAGQAGFLVGTAPTDLGVHNNRLKAPSMTPNSVSSQAELHPAHPQKEYARIAPLKFSGDGVQAMEKLAVVVKNRERTTIVTQLPDYIYAESDTRLLRFRDDMEFWLDKDAGAIQVRSASRIGRGDHGVNRTRIEEIRAQFEKN
jgi:uncharacterized protein (DUF1499 family)